MKTIGKRKPMKWSEEDKEKLKELFFLPEYNGLNILDRCEALLPHFEGRTKHSLFGQISQYFKEAKVSFYSYATLPEGYVLCPNSVDTAVSIKEPLTKVLNLKTGRFTYPVKNGDRTYFRIIDVNTGEYVNYRIEFLKEFIKNI